MWTASPAEAAVAYCDTFSETTPGAYFCVVPAGMTSLDFVVAGGDGGAAIDISEPDSPIGGGHGAKITGSIDVTPGETLDIVVGGDGADGSDAAGAGGGYSSVARDTTPIIVAGAGGGGGYRGGVGGSGTGGVWYDGGGWGGSTGQPGMSASSGASGGLQPFGGAGGDSVVDWTEDLEPLPVYDVAGSGGSYGIEAAPVSGGDAATNTHGGGGGGAFGGAGGLHDVTHNASGEYSAGAAYGAGGNGGYDGGGGGGGYAGGGGGGGGHDLIGETLNAGGGGGGGSSLVPEDSSTTLSLAGAIVTLSGTGTSTTLYVAPDNQTVGYGQSFVGVYGFIISSTADGSTPIEPSSLSNYTPPTCGSAYTSSTSVADSPLTISCGGGSNEGSAGSADGVTFDYTLTGSFTITKATLYVRPTGQDINVGDPVPDASFYAYRLYTDAGRSIEFEGTVDVPPTCGSAYTTTTAVDLTISCGGGSNAGTAASDADYAFDYTDTTTLNVNTGPDLTVTLRVRGASLAPVIGATSDYSVSSIVCSIDDGTDVSCFTGWKSMALTKGVHDIVVTATDSHGLSVSYTGSFTIKSGKMR